MADDPPILVLLDAIQMLAGRALDRWVVLDVDGERVEGTVTGLGTQEAEPSTGSVWYVEVDGRRLTVIWEDLERICSAGDGSDDR